MAEIKLKEISIDEAEFAVLDFETTGTSPRNCRVIEVGIVKVKNNKIVDTFQRFINPGAQIPPYITVLTGISDSEVRSAPFFEDIIDEMTEFIGDGIITAHNLKFDYSFLKGEFTRCSRELPPNSSICTLKIARRIFPELPSKSLASITKHLQVRHKNVHRALGDATVTAKVLLKMMNELKVSHGVSLVNELINFQNLPSGKGNFRIIKKKLADDFSRLPSTPGVYFFKDAKDKIIYIGKAKSLNTRVRNYFSNTANRKEKKISRKASRLSFERTNSELTALLAEAQLIKQHKPQLNTLLKKYSQSYFIRIKKETSFPKIEVTQIFDFDGNDYFGPYASRDTVNLLREIIDKTYMLRECTEKDFGKKRICYLADIKRCIAPCVNTEDAKEYLNEIERVQEFLCGFNQDAVNRLLKKMKDFSERQKYEEAAQIRDTLQILLNQLDKSSIIAEKINEANILFVVKDSDKSDFIVLTKGRVFIKNFWLDEKGSFDAAIEDYYGDTINLFSGLYDKDLEKIKITVNWLVKNRYKTELFYLKDYTSKSELFVAVNSKVRAAVPVED